MAASVGFQRFFVGTKFQLAGLLTVAGISYAYTWKHDQIVTESGRDAKDLEKDLQTLFLAGRQGKKDYAGHVQTRNFYLVEKSDKQDVEDRSTDAGRLAYAVQRTVLGGKLQHRALSTEEEEWLRADDAKMVEEHKLTKEEIQRNELKWQWYETNSPMLMETFIYNQMKSL